MRRKLMQVAILLIGITNVFGGRVFAQEEEFTCSFSQNLTTEDSLALLNGAPTLQDTSLRVGILFVQFADYATNINARGSVGWNSESPNDTVTIEKKFRYHHFWEMYFSRNSYIDVDPQDPEIHPDANSHPTLRLAAYGSMRDYYLEVSHGNLDIKPAVTHPAESDTLFRSGIINRFDPADSSLVWITLPENLAYYNNGTNHTLIRNDAIETAQILFNFPDSLGDSLDIDIEDDTIMDRVLIYVAGSKTGGITFGLNGRYSMWREKAKATSTTTEYLNGFGGFAHEFGHQIGYPDLYNPGSQIVGVGFFSLMGSGTAGGNNLRPTHIDPWDKLQSGWLTHNSVNADTINYVLRPVADTTLQSSPEVAILNGGAGDPATNNWVGGNLEYFILENRSAFGFDTELNFGNQSFGGGMIAWHYAGGFTFPNNKRIRVIEADITAALPEGNLGTSDPNKSDLGSRSDFFPGDSTVTLLDDATIPSLNLASGLYSHYRVKGINYNSADSTVTIDSLQTSNLLTVISQNTTWDQNITLAQDVVIRNNATLTVEPGVIITIDSHTERRIRITVEDGATLSLIGNATSPIVFRSASDSSNQDWEGLIFDEGSDFDLTYTNIENAMLALKLEHVTAAALSNTTLRGLSITDCVSALTISSNVDSLRWAKLTLENVELSANLQGENTIVDSSQFIQSGITSSKSSPIIVTNCVFDSSDFIISGQGRENKIESNIFRLHSTIKISQASSPTIKNNLFLDGSNISNPLLHPSSSPLIINNRFIGINQVGTAINYFGNPVEIRNNTFVFYEYGVNKTIDNFNVKIENNIFYENDKTAGTTGSMIYNIIDNDDTPTGLDTTNIFLDPELVDPTNGDVHLKATSPGVDGGDPDEPYSNEPSPNGGRLNIGAYGNTSEATLSFDLIVQNNLTSDATWSGHINILESISTSGNKLTVSSGTKVLFDNGKTLTATASFFAEGSAGQPGPDPIEFRGYRENDIMGGVYLYPESGDTVLLDYSHFKKAGTGLYVAELTGTQHLFDHLLFEKDTTGFYSSESDLTVTNSIFQENETGMVADQGDVTITDCSFQDNTTQGLHLYYADFDISDSEFQDNGARGVYFQYSSNGTFIDNQVTGNGDSPGEGTLEGGLVCYQSSPFLENNDISFNLASGILSLSSSYPVMINDGYNLVAQNAGNSGSDAAEILVEDISFPVLDRGNNDIADTTGGYLLYGDEDPREFIIDVRYNYWGETDSSNIAGRLHRPGGLNFYPFDVSSNTGSGLFNKSTPPGDPDEIYTLFEAALDAERTDQHQDAIALYDSLIVLYPSAALAKPALERLFYRKLDGGATPGQTGAYFNAYTTHSDTALATIARRMEIRALTVGGDFPNAITEHTSWKSNTQFESDSIYSEVDILSNQLMASGDPFGKMSGGIQKTVRTKGYQRSFTDYMRRSEALLSKLLSDDGTDQAPVKIERFYLAQNYPNPFNPSTTIRIEVPAHGKIRLEVFNVLGQKIKTLLKEDVEAGEYKLVWDGNNHAGNRVASGVYFYRAILTGTNGKRIVRTKKMILLR